MGITADEDVGHGGSEEGKEGLLDPPALTAIPDPVSRAACYTRSIRTIRNLLGLHGYDLDDLLGEVQEEVRVEQEIDLDTLFAA